MRRRSVRHKRGMAVVHLFAAGVMLGGLLEVTQVQAAEAAATNSMDSVLQFLNLKADPGQAPDFVQQTRPSSTEYVPIGRTHPQRVLKPKSASDVKAGVAELDAARAMQEKAATRPVGGAASPAKKTGSERTAPMKIHPATPLRGTQN